MLTCIFVDLQVFYSHSWKSRLLVAFLVLLVVFFMLGWSYFGRIFTKSRSSFGRIISNIWSYFYLTTLILHKSLCTEKTLCIKYTLNNINSLHKNTLCTTLQKKRYSTVKKIILNRDAHYIHNRKVSRVEEMSLIYNNKT